jgi:uncharacterized membrane protein YeiH
MRRGLLWASVSLFAVGIALFGFAGAATAAHFGHGAVVIEVGGAVTLTVFGGMCLRARADRDKTVLIRTLASAVPAPHGRALRPTLPLPVAVVPPALRAVFSQRPR